MPQSYAVTVATKKRIGERFARPLRHRHTHARKDMNFSKNFEEMA